MEKKLTSIEGRIAMHQPQRHVKLFRLLIYSLLLMASFVFACKKDDFKDEVVGDCPEIVSTDPMNKAIDVALSKVITITFNTTMDFSTINSSTFIIKQGTTVIPGKFQTIVNSKTFTFLPDAPLLPFMVYSGTVTTAAKDVFQTAMVADYLWSFTTIPTVTLSANPTIGGTVNGAGAFAEGSNATVSAVPSTGYTFTSWSENGTVVSTSSNYQFKMAGNRTLVANFTAIPVGNFAVLLSSNPVNAGTNSGSGSYAAGSTVTISASTNAGYTFLNWT